MPKDGSPEEILEKSLTTSLTLQEALDATDDIDTIAQITLQAAENGETTWSYGRSNNLAHAIWSIGKTTQRILDEGYENLNTSYVDTILEKEQEDHNKFQSGEPAHPLEVRIAIATIASHMTHEAALLSERQDPQLTHFHRALDSLTRIGAAGAVAGAGLLRLNEAHQEGRYSDEEMWKLLVKMPPKYALLNPYTYLEGEEGRPPLDPIIEKARQGIEAFHESTQLSPVQDTLAAQAFSGNIEAEVSAVMFTAHKLALNGVPKDDIPYHLANNLYALGEMTHRIGDASPLSNERGGTDTPRVILERTLAADTHLDEQGKLHIPAPPSPEGHYWADITDETLVNRWRTKRGVCPARWNVPLRAIPQTHTAITHLQAELQERTGAQPNMIHGDTVHPASFVMGLSLHAVDAFGLQVDK